MTKITGEMMIFKNQYGYTTSINKKNQNGEYDRMYLTIQLPKDVELENKTKINITDGFLSFYNTKDGLPKIKIVVMQFETNNYEKEEREAIQNEEEYTLSENDLPF